jgi:hypothetical protein
MLAVLEMQRDTENINIYMYTYIHMLIFGTVKESLGNGMPWQGLLLGDQLAIGWPV